MAWGLVNNKAVSMAKFNAAEFSIDIVNMALHLFGCNDYSQECEIERICRDVRVYSIYEGFS